MDPCICGFQARTLWARTRHLNKCLTFKSSFHSSFEHYKTNVEGTDNDLRGYKRRRVQVLPTSVAGPSTEPLDSTCAASEVQKHLSEFEQTHEWTVEAEPAADPLVHSSEHDGEPSIGPTGRPQRTRRLPKRYMDELPAPEAPPTISQPIPRIVLHVRQPFQTSPNMFGLFRRYIETPSYIPDDGASLLLGHLDTPVNETPTLSDYHPFPNFSQYRLASWFATAASGTVSGPLFDQLLSGIQDPRFDPQDCKGFSHHRMLNLLNSVDSREQSVPWLSTKDQWQLNRTITISLPEGKTSWTSPQGRKVDINGLHTRSIVEILRNVYSMAKDVHYTPYELFHQSGNSEQRVYGEVFGSPACISEYRKLPKIANCDLERTIALLMFWSDATHLTNFGTQKLWLIYMAFGSQSKYTRIQPKCRQFHHVAYIPSLPDSIQDIIRDFTGGKAARSPILTHCRRELMHGAWELLLDEEFMDTYKNGIAIMCPDGIQRRVFPRIFTYSADYPEKVLLATIRDKGLCPCPRCLVTKANISQMGTARDMRARSSKARHDTLSRRNRVQIARELVYKDGMSLQSKRVDDLLKEHSLVPTVNAFSHKLFQFGFDFHKIFVVDFLHEIELGVWKAVFTHLIWLLYADQEAKVQELNKRYRSIPIFGRDTIRRFANNVAEMKKLAARNFEDILQCAIPVFEGLFSDPKLDTLVQDLLFIFCSWHGVCKLRLHTDNTLSCLENETRALGKILREFKSMTDDLPVSELPREVSARQRRQSENAKINSAGPKHKKMNNTTYKFHAIGDFADAIRSRGTIESYSTQAGECQHRTVKRRFLRASRNETAKSLASIETQERHIHAINAHLDSQKSRGSLEACSYIPPQAHYHISSSRKCPVDIPSFLQENKDDIATKNFYRLLKDHILGRLMGMEYDGDETQFTADDRNQVFIKNDRLYEHKMCHLNFTTYDVRRGQDIVNPGNGHSDIMVLSRENPDEQNTHTFWYARVIGIFHVKVCRRLPNSQLTPDELLHVLWVRWFGKDFQFQAGYKARRMDRLAFIGEEDDTEPFGFLDPALVLRTAHIIPAFAYGLADESDFTSSPLAHPSLKFQKDWRYYYANRFVDRDMLMRYLQQGIGHTFTGSVPGNGDPSHVVDEPEAEEIESINCEADQDGDCGDVSEEEWESEDEPDVSSGASSGQDSESESDLDQGYASG